MMFWDNPILRNFECSIIILVTYLIGKILNSHKSLHILLILISIFLGLFWLNDPFFLYTCGLSLVLVIIYEFFKEKNKIARFKIFTTSIYTILSFVFYKVFYLIFASNNILILDNFISTKFTSFENIENNIKLAIESIIKIFNIDIWGKDLFSIESILALLILIIICLLLISYKSKESSLSASNDRVGEFLKNFFLLLIPVTILQYILSSNVTNITTSRYFVLIPFALGYLLTCYVPKLKNKYMLILISLILITNILTYISTYNSTVVVHNRLERNNYEKTIIKDLEGLENEKGYAGYWASAVINYFSKYKINTVPFLCKGKKLLPFNYLTDKARLLKYSTKSYIIFEYKGASPYSNECTLDTIKTQFGNPDEEKTYSWGKILRYNYDVTVKNEMYFDLNIK